MPRAATPLALLVLCLAAVWAANPTLKIGGVLAQCGASSALSIKMAESLQWWAKYINAKGGITVNGTQYDVQVIRCGQGCFFPSPCGDELTLFTSYNDAFDPQLRGARLSRAVQSHKCFPAAILYDRLINVDKVDALLGPFGGSVTPSFALARAARVPVLVTGSYCVRICVLSIGCCYMWCVFGSDPRHRSP